MTTTGVFCRPPSAAMPVSTVRLYAEDGGVRSFDAPIDPKHRPAVLGVHPESKTADMNIKTWIVERGEVFAAVHIVAVWSQERLPHMIANPHCPVIAGPLVLTAYATVDAEDYRQALTLDVDDIIHDDTADVILEAWAEYKSTPHAPARERLAGLPADCDLRYLIERVKNEGVKTTKRRRRKAGM